MDFHRTLPAEGMPHRWASENNIWEIGLRPMLYGVRVSVGRINPECGCALVYTLDYCAGDDEDFLLNLLATLLILMTALPESILPQQLERLFPTYQIKPINKDPDCWKRLQQLARLDNPFPSVCS